jgi:hypothetical protein
MMRNGRGQVIVGWDRFDAYNIHGVVPPAAVNGAGAGAGRLADVPLVGVAGPSLLEKDSDKPWHPDSPMFWVAAFLAVTLGFIAASTSIRVGPFKAAVSAGQQ